MSTLRHALLLSCALVLIFATPAAAQRWPGLGESAKTSAVRVVHLQGIVSESRSPFDILGSDDAVVFHELIGALHREARDPKVKAIVVRLGGALMGLAQIEDLAEALAAAKKRGKRVIVHAETVDNRMMLAATAGHELHVVPEGTVVLTGLQAEVSFYADLLSTLGISVDVEAIGRYKSAAESYTRRTMSDAAKEQLNALLDSVYGRLLEGIGAHRKLTPAKVEALVDVGLFTAEQAQREGLVDGLTYWQDLLESLEKRYRGEATLAFPIVEEAPEIGSIFGIFELLTKSDEPPETGRPKVALVTLEGPIISGRNPSSLFSDQRVIASEDVVQTLKVIRAEPSVKAIVVRVDSPGGSALASDVIWRELARMNKRRPVVVSMGNVAASGGYYIASAAKRILAQDTTITGSIGVFGGKMVLDGLFDKIGVNTVVLSRGKHAGMMSSLTRFSDSERAVFREHMSHTYKTFVNRVREGRNMSWDAADKVARGRVWTGAQALAVGLVDELGGLEEAIAAAAKLAHIKLADVDVVEYPKARSLLDVLSGDPVQLAAPPKLQLGDLLEVLPHPIRERAIRAARMLDVLLEREWVLTLMPHQITLR